jgi:hypothetical protein
MVWTVSQKSPDLAIAARNRAKLLKLDAIANNEANQKGAGGGI